MLRIAAEVEGFRLISHPLLTDFMTCCTQGMLQICNCIGSVYPLSIEVQCWDHRRGVQESGEEQGLPVQGTCPGCGAAQTWGDVLSRGESVPWRQSRYLYFVMLHNKQSSSDAYCRLLVR